MDPLHRKNVEYVKFITVQADALSADGPSAEFSPDDMDAAFEQAREWSTKYPAFSIRTQWRAVRDENSEEVLADQILRA